MLSRRATLLGSVGLVGWLAEGPALAAGRRPAGHPIGRRITAKTDPAKTAAAAAAPPETPADTPLGPVATTARWAYMEDFETGAVLLSKAADEEMTPSSMTKLMTLYILFTRLKEKRLKLTDQLPVSATAWRMGGSKMFVEVGTSVSVEDLIKGIIVDSGNDACIVVAEAIAGSQAQFAKLMNEEAKRLGLTHSHFMNPTGWPEDGHYMSAHDIARVAVALIRDFPEYYHYFGDKTFKYSNITQENRNELVDRGTADGLKTGHTDAGGFGLVASTEHGGQRIVLVLNGMPSSRQRAEQGERLMAWGFANFEDVTLFSAGDVVDRAPVWLGVSRDVPLVGGRAIVATLPRSWRSTAKIKVDFDAPVRAPVARGTPLGTLSISGQGVPAGATFPLLAGADVPKLGLPGRALAALLHYVTGS